MIGKSWIAITASLLLFGGGKAMAQTGIAYTWISDATNATVSPIYSLNPGGQPITATHPSTGVYAVTFAGSGIGIDWDVQVSAYGNDTNYCKVSSWGGSVINIRCFDTTGNAINSRFTVLAVANTNDKQISSAWAEQPSAASYTPNNGYAFNTSGGTITINRTSTGNYTVTFGGISGNGGTVQVTSYGSTNSYCYANNWSGTAQFIATVGCRDGAGNLVDSQFVISVIPASVNPGGIAFSWANDALSSTYTPTAQWTYNPGGTVQITRSSQGRYAVTFTGINTAQVIGGLVQVTSYITSDRCKVVSWGPGTTASNLVVNVACNNLAGNPADTRYEVLVIPSPTSSSLRFVPLTPCRLVDTRALYSGTRTGAFGPPALVAAGTRTIAIPTSPECSVPATAKAYVLNITLDTFQDATGPVDFVTVWPAGETRPNFFTARTTTGGYIANAAIVKAGTNGAVSVYSSSNVNFIMDISGYFTDDVATPTLLYYPLSPCRAVDTRGPIYSSLPAPYGNQRMLKGENRTFRLPGSPACSIPVAAAYSMQLTLAPGELTNGSPVAFITAYPTGVAQPNVSNMNALLGFAVANSAIVPASANGSIDVYAFDATNLIIDVNGYFAADDGTGRGLSYFPVTQCRVVNTQDSSFTGAFGPIAISPGGDRTVPVPSGPCTGLPSSAKAWAMNAWVVPGGLSMPYLSLWPSGTPWPNISQLNAFQGQTVANSGIVPAAATGSIDVRVAATTHVGLEISGYFSR